MQVERGTSIRLNIPFYRQHYDFTCGPSCLMMAMKYLDTGMSLSTELEIDLWREGTLVFVPGASRYGLAFSAAVRGFSARVTSNTGGIDFVDKFVVPLKDSDMDLLRDQFFERRARCRKLGVRERRTIITDRTIYRSLQSNHIPLIVTSTSFYSNEDLPHWVVVTGIDDRFMYFNNPADPRLRKRTIGLPDLKTFIGYHGDQSMVELWRD
ncbi:MAG TPA: hypothetical protein HA263_10750 [Methanoregulaceae archaeon]|nr:hypothetical protein [Methanoregulaceae archaeon]